MVYKPIDLHKKKSQILVIHCADPRFQEAYRLQIDALDKYYDLLAVPGASKAVADNQLIVDYAKLLHELHHFSEIHIMDHVECGAFGPVSDEVKEHSAELEVAINRLEEAIPGISVKGYLLGQDKNLLA